MTNQAATMAMKVSTLTTVDIQDTDTIVVSPLITRECTLESNPRFDKAFCCTPKMVANRIMRHLERNYSSRGSDLDLGQIKHQDTIAKLFQQYINKPEDEDCWFNRDPDLLQYDLALRLDELLFGGILNQHIRANRLSIQFVEKIPQIDIAPDEFVTARTFINPTKDRFDKKLVTILIAENPSYQYGGRRERKRMRYYNANLVHEMIHAAFFLFCCQCERCDRKFQRQMGEDGHGGLFLELAMNMEDALNRYFSPYRHEVGFGKAFE